MTTIIRDSTTGIDITVADESAERYLSAGYILVGPPEDQSIKPTKPKTPTKAELEAQAEELGVDITGLRTKAEIEVAIAEFLAGSESGQGDGDIGDGDDGNTGEADESILDYRTPDDQGDGDSAALFDNEVETEGDEDIVTID
jgi:hypothetical protein